MISIDDIRKLAKLAKLRLTEEELGRLTSDMEKIIGFADTVNRAELITAVGPGPAKDVAGENNWREDEARPSFPQAEILKNVDGGENGFFSVRKRSS